MTTATNNENNNPHVIDLELTSELTQTGIVNRFAFYRKTNAIQVLLNHHYDSKSIVFSVDKRDWNNTHSIFEKQLKQKGIDKKHIRLLSDIIDNNYQAILSLEPELESDSDSGSEQQQSSSSYQDQNGDEEDDVDDKESAAQVALRLAQELCSSIFMDQFGTPYAAITVGNHIETLQLKSSRFRNWLCKIFYTSAAGGGNILTSDNVINVLSILKARAEFDSGDRSNLHLRVATAAPADEPNNTIYYDLTNKDWEFIKITDHGWSVIQSNDAPIMFKRHSNHQPQVYPCKSKEYSPDIFDKFMRLINLKGEDNQLLLKCYIISLFYPEIPKPVLMLHGEQGSAKSTLQELIRMIVDPSSILTLTFPRDINELVQKLSHNYVAYFDNISDIPEWISDQLCRAVTGSGFSKRELYTDDDDIIYNFKRSIGFNGINLGATKADLLDRGLIIELERIAKENQRKIEDIWAEFQTIKPQLLAYVFDTLVGVLQVKASGGVAHEIDGLPRMADFAEIGEIISRCMGHENNKFLGAYYRNIDLQVEQAIAANLVGNAIIQFMEVNESNKWIGSFSQLLLELEAKAASLNINVKDRSWPKSASYLSRKLNQIKTSLREVGITIDYYKDQRTRLKTIEICKVPSVPSETQNQARIISDFSDDTNTDRTAVSFGNNMPFEETKQNRAQNSTLNDTNDTNDTLHTLQGQYSSYPPICYYCDYKPDSKDDYEGHVVLGHGHSIAYPNKAEIEKWGLKPQDKDWET
jgi:hypothetical protein